MFTAAIIFFVGVLNYLVSPLIVNKTLNLKDALWFQGITLAVSVIPVSIFFLVKQNQLLKKFTAQAELLQKQLKENQDEVNKQERVIEEQNNNEKEERQQIDGISDLGNTNKITFMGDYLNGKIELDVEKLYFITSASNYIKIYHLVNDKLVYSIIRLTLKKAEEILKDYPIFLKCHRAFIINIDKVVHVEGNAQGFRIKIKDHEELVPISRSINNEFSDKLLAYRKKFGATN
jgi:DNA-binding LytR/AlgR family response regulator